MKFIEKAFEIIQKNIEEGDFCKPIDKDKILIAQQILNLEFPKSYKQFLEKYGCGDIFGQEFYGIIKDPVSDGKGVPNMIWATRNYRKKYNLPHEYIIIGDVGYGPWYIIDTSQKNTEGESPVLMYGGGYATEKLADSFGEFLYKELKTAMEEEKED